MKKIFDFGQKNLLQRLPADIYIFFLILKNTTIKTPESKTRITGGAWLSFPIPTSYLDNKFTNGAKWDNDVVLKQNITHGATKKKKKHAVDYPERSLIDP